MSTHRREVTFSAFERWGWDERGLSRATRTSYVRRARFADRWLSAERSTYLWWASAKHLKDFMSALPAEAPTRNNHRVALISFGQFCIDQGWREDNPALELTRLPTRRSVPKPLTVEEARRVAVMAESFDPMHRALFLLLLYGGLRRTEARRVEWKDLKPGWVTVVGKGNRERDVPLHADAEQALMLWKMRATEPRWVFSVKRGRVMSDTYFYRKVRDLGEMSGLPNLHPHQLRHTCATRLLETKSDLREVQEYLGHASPQTTTIYTLVRPTRLKEAAARLDFGQ